MLLLYLDLERTLKDGRGLNRYTIEFILDYTIECMSDKELELCTKKK